MSESCDFIKIASSEQPWPTLPKFKTRNMEIMKLVWMTLITKVRGHPIRPTVCHRSIEISNQNQISNIYTGCLSTFAKSILPKSLTWPDRNQAQIEFNWTPSFTTTPAASQLVHPRGKMLTLFTKFNVSSSVCLEDQRRDISGHNRVIKWQDVQDAGYCSRGNRYLWVFEFYFCLCCVALVVEIDRRFVRWNLMNLHFIKIRFLICVQGDRALRTVCILTLI